MKKFNEILTLVLKLTTKQKIAAIVAIIAVSIFTSLIIQGNHPNPTAQTQTTQTKHQEHSEIWTCSMHPQIKADGPGKCPICGMDLIPVETTNDNDQSYSVKLSDAAIKLAEVSTVGVQRKILPAEVRMVGKVDFDETREAHISAWFPGRIERLFVDYTGIKVNKGDHMVELYSPEILATQEELLQAIQATKKISKSNYSSIRQLTQETVKDVRNKLKLWGFSEDQIKEIEQRKKTTNKMTVNAPVGGVVIKKYIQEGMYVKTGSKIYSIADLSHLWIKLDAYESDIELIKYGQMVEFYTESLPGIVFKGRVSFISPVLDSETQTIKVRVNVENTDGKLRPGMFVHAKIFSQISSEGVVMDDYLQNKMVCPMHPEVIEKEPGKCPICGMHLVPTEKLGYINNKGTAPMVIPVSAPLITGERAIVYVDQGNGKYLGRQIALGLKVGDHYIVKTGLHEGENVVVNGNFKIDSAAQLLAKPSMMNPEGGGKAPAGHANHVMEKKIQPNNPAPNQFKKQLDQIILDYLQIHKELSQDRYTNLNELSKKLLTSLSMVDMKLVSGEKHIKWMEISRGIQNSAEQIMQSSNIDLARKNFLKLSDSLISSIDLFGTSGLVKTNRFFCPMYLDKGGFWLQDSEKTLNPYFGQKMITCGEKR